MSACDFELGKRIRHIQTREIFEVQLVEGLRSWVGLSTGDVYDWVDEDLFDDLDYYNIKTN